MIDFSKKRNNPSLSYTSPFLLDAVLPLALGYPSRLQDRLVSLALVVAGLGPAGLKKPYLTNCMRCDQSNNPLDYCIWILKVPCLHAAGVAEAIPPALFWLFF